MSTKPTAIIIGAGYGGMALANILGKAGYTVHVYEKNQKPGGRIAATIKDGFVFDVGPSWYLMPEVFDQYYSLFAASATERLDLIRFTPGYKVFFDDHEPVYIQGDVKQDRNVFESIESGAGDKLEGYVDRSSTAYELAVNYFLYSNFDRLRDLFKWPILRNAPSMLRLTFGSLHRYVSNIFRDQRLHQLLEYHMVFLGSSPFQAPAIYTLMSHLDYRSGVFYPKRGMLSLVDDMQALGKEYDIMYHYGVDVREISVSNGSATGITLADGTTHAADVVISNADLHHTETVLVPEQYRSFPEAHWAKRQSGPGALLLSLGVTGELPELIHHNLYFVDDWKGNFDAIYGNKRIPEHASIYICNPTKTDPSLAPDGHENVFILMPLPSGIDLSDKEQQELADRTIDQLADIAGIKDLRERITTQSIFGPRDFGDNYNAWQYNAFGGESHLLKQSVIFRTPNKSKKLDNLYYVGAGTLPGIGLPMCLISAEMTYKKIAGIKKSGPLEAEDF